LGSFAKLLFGISPRETSPARRGFRGVDSGASDRRDPIGRNFLVGYHAALENARLESLVPRLEQVEPAFRGFAYEGAAMGLALLDWCTPWNRRRVDAFLASAAGAHSYMIHVGAGWVLARVPASVDRFLQRFDPLLRWLVVDGYGFHEGFFRWNRYAGGQPAPGRLKGYAARVFDQGLGRCLWFIEAANVSEIVRSIGAFASARQADLWSGVGLAAVYAGEASEPDLKRLREGARAWAGCLGQGAAFAAKARQRAGNLSSYQDDACRILCGLPALDAARLTDETLENLPSDDPEPGYEIWRKRIQARILPSAVLRK
jgi:hypothetical protein